MPNDTWLLGLATFALGWIAAALLVYWPSGSGRQGYQPKPGNPIGSNKPPTGGSSAARPIAPYLTQRAPSFPTVKGVQFFARDSDGQWYYVSCANTWQACPPMPPDDQ